MASKNDKIDESKELETIFYNQNAMLSDNRGMKSQFKMKNDDVIQLKNERQYIEQLKNGISEKKDTISEDKSKI